MGSLLKLTTIVAFSLLLLSNAAANGEKAYLQGVKSYKAGEYKQALVFFKRADNLGYKNPKVFYNQGVSFIKLKQFRDAQNAFEQVQSDAKLGAISHYNLGLIADQLGEEKSAQVHYETALSTTNNKKIQTLSKSKLQPKKRSKVKQKTLWTMYGNVTAGYDDNVNLVGEDEASNISDQFLQGFFKFRLYLPMDFRFATSLFEQQYLEESEQNFRVVKLGFDRPFKFKNWRITPAVDFSHAELNNESFQDTYDFKLTAKRRFGVNRFSFQYRLSDLHPVSDFAFLAGTRQRFRTTFQRPTPVGKLRFRYQLEVNDREDEANESHSPTRHSGEIKLTYDFTKQLDAFVETTYRVSDFSSKGSGSSRQDDRVQFAIGASYRLNKTWSLEAKVEHTDNQSNQAGNDFERNVWTIGGAASF
ncbi:MAG: outer membrane beta-barrel protein [Methylococcales bacterium]|nr:outer membrane beta-barrel protein [Methylococcales bacterium]